MQGPGYSTPPPPPKKKKKSYSNSALGLQGLRSKGEEGQGRRSAAAGSGAYSSFSLYIGAKIITYSILGFLVAMIP